MIRNIKLHLLCMGLVCLNGCGSSSGGEGQEISSVSNAASSSIAVAQSLEDIALIASNLDDTVLDELITDAGIKLVANWKFKISSIALEIARDKRFSDVLVSETLSDTSAYTSDYLTIGKYYIRLRAENSSGQKSDWSSPQEVNLGLFVIEPDIAQKQANGITSQDAPIDFVLDGKNILLLSARSNVNTGDSTDGGFNIASLSIRSNKVQSDESFLSISDAPLSLTKTKEGVVAVGRASNSSSDSVIIGVDDSGKYLWHKTTQADRLSENIKVAASLADGRLVYANDFRIAIFDENRENPDFLSVPHPLKGAVTEDFSRVEDYYYIGQMLVDEDEIFVVGTHQGYGRGEERNVSPSGDQVEFPLVRDGEYDKSFLAKITSDSVIEGTVLARGILYPNAISKSGNDVIIGHARASDYRCLATLFYGDGGFRVISLSDMSYCHPVLNNDQEIVIVGKDNSELASGESLVVVRLSNNTGKEIDRISLNRFSSNFNLLGVKHDSILGTVILGTDKIDSNANDTRTVIFNISDKLEHVVN